MKPVGVLLTGFLFNQRTHLIKSKAMKPTLTQALITNKTLQLIIGLLTAIVASIHLIELIWHVV